MTTPTPPSATALEQADEIRGLLCYWCNKYLGWIGDTPDKLSRVLLYQQEGYRALYNTAD